ncbi:hypothetical protein [Bacillus solimangrovi]|uniref:hypothetical protein n=1 Tax=Bacillus solimangrovi TaxID=1305675 RepID=UPI001112DAE9|nr:hypothetical protein [Bacillus solimangrovi]
MWQQKMLATKDVVDFNAGVLEVGNDEQPPIVVITKMTENEPSLLLYKLDPDDQFKFHTIEVNKLMSIPEEVEFSDKYIYLKMEDEWYHYNRKTELQRSNIHQQVSTNFVDFSVKEKEGFYELYIENNMLPTIHRVSERPILIQLLNEKPKAWLVVFENSVSVLKEPDDK